MKKTKVLFVVEAITPSHIVRPYQLACALNKNKYEVHFASDHRTKKLFNNKAITFHPIKSISRKAFIERIQSSRPMYTSDELIKYANEEHSLITEINPSVVIGDLRQSLSISTRLSNTPYIAMANAYWSREVNHGNLPVPEIKNWRLDKLPFIQYLMPLLSRGLFGYHGKSLIKARAHFGLPGHSHYLDSWNTGDFTFYYDFPELFSFARLPDNHRFIGPVNWEPAIKLPKWWNQLEESKPTAYICLGPSEGNEPLQPLVAKLLGLGYQIIISGIKEGLRAGHWPKSIFTAEHIPGSIAAARADVVLSNGGSPISYQSLLSGTPVIGIPSNMDQLLAMRYVERANVGRILRTNDVLTPRCEAVLTEVQSPDVQKAIQALLQTVTIQAPEDEFELQLQSVLKRTQKNAPIQSDSQLIHSYC